MNRLMHDRKAQITVFMIIGIILLFSSALLFYIRNEVAGGISDEFIPTIEEVPLEAQPIKIFVEDCIGVVGRRGIELLGKHGGYIEPKNFEMTGTTFLLGLEPTESDGVMFLGENTVVPYWWYLETPNTCSGNCNFDSLKPPLRKNDGLYSVESQMGRYINRELESCLDNFRAFTAQGFTIESLGPVNADVLVTEKDIAIVVDYPIRVVRGGNTIDVKQFFTTLDLNFKDIYEMAEMVVDKQIDTDFLETHTLNALTMAAMPLSMERIPPIAEFTVNPNEFMVWTRSKTQQQLEQLVLPYAIGNLQIDQTRNFKRIVMFDKVDDTTYLYDRIGTAITDKTILRLDKNYTNIDAKFIYLDWWNIYLDINHMEILIPTSIDIPVIGWFLGLNQYEFFYSLAYPVVVELDDADAFAGDGYKFQFAIEQNLRYNKPINMTNISYAGAGDQGTLVCAQNQNQGAKARIEVKNLMTGEPIEKARVSAIFGQESCHVGITEINEENKSIIEANLPVGLGEIKAVHIDYLEFNDRLFSTADVEQNITIEMAPYRYINVSVFAKTLHYDTDGRYVLPPGDPLSPLGSHENVVLVLERKDEDALEDFKAYGMVTRDSMALMKLVPGTYEVKGYLIYNDTVRINSVDKTYDGGLFGSSTDVKLNATELDVWTEGGILFTNETGYFKITEEDLFGSQKLNIFVLRFALPMVYATEFGDSPSLEQAGKLDEYSNMYRLQLEPEWVI